MNQTRKACALFFEMYLDRFHDGVIGPHHWGFEDFDEWISRQNNVCAQIHSRPCSTSARYWRELGSIDNLREV